MQPEEWSPPKATLREEVERLRAQLQMIVQREENAVQATAHTCRDHAYNVFEGQQHGFREAAARLEMKAEDNQKVKVAQQRIGCRRLQWAVAPSRSSRR